VAESRVGSLPAPAAAGAGAAAHSGLTTLGRCLIAAGGAAIVCAGALNERDLLCIGAVLVVLPLLASALARRIRLVLRAERAVEPTRLTAGDPARVSLRVEAPRWLLGGGLVLTDALPDALGGSPVFIAHPRRRATVSVLEYQLVPAVRGLHQIGPLTARAGDPLGLAEHERVLAERSTLIVYPRTTVLEGLPEGFGLGRGDAGASGLRWGPGEHDVMVRAYQPGDPLRSVHWRSTARHDELMVRIEERPWHGGVSVLLDRRAGAHAGHGARASLEWSIELVASVCRHLIAAGRRVSLIAENGVALASGRDIEQLLESLAALRPSAQPELVPPPRGDGELFAVLGAVDAEAVLPLIEAAESGRGHAVLLDVPAWASGRASSARGEIAAPSRALTEAGWTVQVARPERTPDQVWTEFRRRLAERARLG